jgi:hypothetical protein
MEITRSGSEPCSKGPADWFTGAVRIDPLFQAPASGGRNWQRGDVRAENFCGIVGSSAGALIGLQFVVLTLIAEMPSARADAQAAGAFATPSVVHSGVVLLLPPILMAYAALGVSAWVAGASARTAMFLAGAVTLLLLFVGIHNAWDTVTQLVFVRGRDERARP